MRLLVPRRTCSLSFDIFVQGFERGDARRLDATALRDRLALNLVDVGGGWQLHAGSSTAEIHGIETLESGFMVTHVDGTELYDLLVEVAVAFDLVILPASAVVVVTRDEQMA